MTFLEQPDDDEARALYEADLGRQGYVANYTRLFAQRPEVDTAWKQLSATVRGGMDQRRYELVTLAAAKQLRSSYCMLAHGKILAERFHDEETVCAIASDHRAAELDTVDRAVMDLAGQVARDATSVTRADIDRLRVLGLTDRDIFDVVSAAALRCFFSKTLDALGCEPDSAYLSMTRSLRETLTVGRPIASEGSASA